MPNKNKNSARGSSPAGQSGSKGGGRSGATRDEAAERSEAENANTPDPGGFVVGGGTKPMAKADTLIATGTGHGRFGPDAEAAGSDEED